MNQTLKKALLFPFDCLYRISPKTELKLLFWMKQKYPLNLDHPRTFNEKLQWMKLNYDDPVREQCSDKFAVRSFVEARCPETLVKLYWQGYDAEKLPFDELPEKFVIKVTHGSGFNIICPDKAKLNREKTVKQLNTWLKEKYILCYGEAFYGKVKPSIIVEEYLEANGAQGLIDYKVMCFDGQPKYIWVAFDRYSKEGPQGVVFDTHWNVIENVWMSYPLRDRAKIPAKPEQLDELLECARKLSAGLPHVRVDMYISNGKIIFGEMSFSHGAGLDKIKPYEFDVELGSHWILPECPGGKNDRKKTD